MKAADVFADDSIILQCPKVGHQAGKIPSYKVPTFLASLRTCYSSRHHGLQGKKLDGGWRDGSAVGRLRLRTVLVEALSLAPSTHIWQFTTTHNFRSRGPDTLFWPLLRTALKCINTWIYVLNIKVRMSAY